jgi:hypothetical protein
VGSEGASVKRVRTTIEVLESTMPDMNLGVSGTGFPRPVIHPGSVFPDVQFRVQRVKVTLIATLELTTNSDICRARECVEKALAELRGYAGDRLSVSYEKL